MKKKTYIKRRLNYFRRESKNQINKNDNGVQKKIILIKKREEKPQKIWHTT